MLLVKYCIETKKLKDDFTTPLNFIDGMLLGEIFHFFYTDCVVMCKIPYLFQYKYTAKMLVFLFAPKVAESNKNNKKSGSPFFVVELIPHQSRIHVRFWRI